MLEPALLPRLARVAGEVAIGLGVATPVAIAVQALLSPEPIACEIYGEPAPLTRAERYPRLAVTLGVIVFILAAFAGVAFLIGAFL